MFSGTKQAREKALSSWLHDVADILLFPVCNIFGDLVQLGIILGRRVVRIVGLALSARFRLAGSLFSGTPLFVRRSELTR